MLKKIASIKPAKPKTIPIKKAIIISPSPIPRPRVINTIRKKKAAAKNAANICSTNAFKDKKK